MNDIFIMLLGMFVAFSVTLALVLWRYWSRMRPRAIVLRYKDQQAFLYRLTEGLGSAGFKRAAGGGSQVVFEPGGLRKSLGAMGITVDLQAPDTARIIGAAWSIARIKRIFPTAQDQVYSGPSPVGNWMKGLAKVFVGLLLALVVLSSGAFLYDRSTRGPDGASPRDVEQTLELTASDAAHGVEWNVPIKKTGKIFTINVPPGVKNGTRLRMRGKGISGGIAAAGDLYIVISVK